MTLQDLQEFWELVAEVWHDGIAGIDIGRIIVALGILFVFFVLRGLIAYFIVSGLRRMTKRTKWTFDDKIVDAIAPPLRAVPVVFGIFVASNYLQFEGVVDLIAQNVTRTLIAIVIFWTMVRAVEPFSYAFKNLEHVLGRELIEWVVKAMRVAVVVIGAATILQIWGIEIGPIIAGAGLFGLAVALGAQDLFKNLIAGILILAEKRFRKGDWIRVDGVVEGIVEAIGFRSTVVRRFDQAPVLVPNAHLSDTAVTNFSEMIYRRIYWHIGVEYRTTVDQLRTIRDEIARYIDENEDFVDSSKVSTFVRIDRFNDSSIDILVYCFTHTIVWGEWLQAKENLAYAIKKIVEDAGTSFAFPSTSIYLESTPDERPETFVPPSSDKNQPNSAKFGAEPREDDGGAETGEAE